MEVILPEVESAQCRQSGERLRQPHAQRIVFWAGTAIAVLSCASPLLQPADVLWSTRIWLLIPHIIILWLLGILAWFLMFFVWVPVLVFGRQAELIYTLVGGLYRWQLRVSSYLLLMVDRYPPFTLGEDDPRL